MPIAAAVQGSRSSSYFRAFSKGLVSGVSNHSGRPSCPKCCDQQQRNRYDNGRAG